MRSGTSQQVPQAPSGRASPKKSHVPLGGPWHQPGSGLGEGRLWPCLPGVCGRASAPASGHTISSEVTKQ